VQEGHVSAWDDPRIPTIVGLCRRGYTPESIRNFCERIGVAKRENIVDVALLEHAVREDLNARAPRVMGVLDPLRVVIENYPEDLVEEFELANIPEDPSAGTRRVPFARELFIEREDFMEDPPKKFFRLAPGREARLRGAYFVTCTGVVKNDAGEVVELRCSYDPTTRGGNAPDGRKVKATLHWVAAKTSLEVEVRVYDRLFNSEQPGAGGDFRADLNAASLQVQRAKLEPSVASAAPGARFQFERLGYFCVDPDSNASGLVFNRTVSLKDSWVKVRSSF